MPADGPAPSSQERRGVSGVHADAISVFSENGGLVLGTKADVDGGLGVRLNPVLTASVNSAAGVMGKMISIQSIAVAVAATGMTHADESRLFRFTIKHSILLMVLMGIISMMFAYVFPHYVPISPPK